ncbi:hypothetical protein BJ997_003724 [Cryobacterium roopkundense]|uniref:Uncharacterized protein n=1 Tax=Cryobacterium roopkundense TaxID=1001240 RepID=A0A7W9E5G1_9MICO|nr:hypothetical protein [Cryobacterium roopkundense]
MMAPVPTRNRACAHMGEPQTACESGAPANMKAESLPSANAPYAQRNTSGGNLYGV